MPLFYLNWIASDCSWTKTQTPSFPQCMRLPAFLTSPLSPHPYGLNHRPLLCHWNSARRLPHGAAALSVPPTARNTHPLLSSWLTHPSGPSLQVTLPDLFRQAFPGQPRKVASLGGLIRQFLPSQPQGFPAYVCLCLWCTKDHSVLDTQDSELNLASTVSGLLSEQRTKLLSTALHRVGLLSSTKKC